MTFAEELDEAKRTLATREMAVQDRLNRDRQALLRGENPSRSATPALGDVYNELLEGLEVNGEQLVDYAEDLADEFYRETHGMPSAKECRGLVLSAACTISMLWHQRARDERVHVTRALGHLSAEFAARADAWNGNGPEWFPEPPEWLALWETAMEATRAEDDAARDLLAFERTFEFEGLGADELRGAVDFARLHGWDG